MSRKPRARSSVGVKEKPVKPLEIDPLTTPPKGKPGRKSIDELKARYRQNLMRFWQYLYDYKEGEYWPIGAFIELPSQEEYPDYYEVVKLPIDMMKIKYRIENTLYTASTQLIGDFCLMFNNCRMYNETDSDLYKDAMRLESMVRLLHEQTPGAPFQNPVATQIKPVKTNITSNGSVKTNINSNGTNGYTPSPKVMKEPKMHHKERNPLLGPMWDLFNYLRDYKDETGRRISEIFLKLPSKQDYPDYFDVIKRPIDFHVVQLKITGSRYNNFNDLVADFRLMFDNACRYNEADSQVYRDAVLLQSLLLGRKKEICTQEDSTPHVQVELRTIFTSIFAAVLNAKDHLGRSLSNSLMTELPELLKASDLPQDEWPFSLEQIKKNLDKCRYRRLDRFQQDIFNLFEVARQYARSDSQLFDDAVDLQKAFMQERDERCKGILSSSALLYLSNNFHEMTAKQRKEKAKAESDEERQQRETSTKKPKEELEEDLPECAHEDITYKPMDYVYIRPSKENSKAPLHVMRIRRIFKNDEDEIMLSGTWFLRPHETFHRASRKFYENELCYTTNEDTVAFGRLAGKCVVLYAPVYLKKKAKDFSAEDTFVCEWRYMGRQLFFTKLKSWPFDDEDTGRFELEDREADFQAVKVQHDFTQQSMDVDQTSESSTNDSEEEEDRCRDGPHYLDITRCEVPSKTSEEDADGRVYFQQMIVNNKHYTVGDFVLVFNPARPLCDVMRIDKLWREADGAELFSGAWFARASQVVHDPSRMFYHREVFAVFQPDQTRSIMAIQSKCSVLQAKDAIRMRITEIPECDVYICEQRVDGHAFTNPSECSLFSANSGPAVNGQTPEAVQSGQPMNLDYAKKVRVFRTYSLAPEIPEDEVFYFKTPLVMEKEISPLLAKNELPPLDLDAEIDDADVDTDGTDSAVGTPAPGDAKSSWLAHQPKLNAKSKSGYILFSAEIRKRIMHENPDAGFGEVSKIVGVEWKKLTDEQKKQYEVRAEYIATERAKVEQATNATTQALQPNQCRVWLCKWINCEFMCDHSDGLYDHLVHYHTSQIIPDSEQQFICMWGQCVRNRKDGKPFPSLPRLHRHLKEKHMQSACKVIYNNQRGRNFYRYITPVGDGGHGQLHHYPYGMHPTQVAQAHPAQSAHLPPQVPNNAVMVNGDSHPRLNGHDSHHGPPTIHHYQAMPGPSQSGQAVYAVHTTNPPTQAAQPQQPPAPPQHGQIADPARTIIMPSRGVEPVFVPASKSIAARRSLHTEAYLKYLESLNGKQRTVSKYGRSLASNPRNTAPSTSRHTPYQWIKNSKPSGSAATEEELVSALWKLRDQILESTAGIATEYQGPL